MNRPGTRERGRIHVVDLVVLVLAAGLAVLAYTYLFRNSPISRPVDPLLGAEVDLQFKVEHPWQTEFPAAGAAVEIEEYLRADVVRAETRATGRAVTLKIRDRSTQNPDALTLFRGGLRRGSLVTLNDRANEVRAEVVEVRLLPGTK